jgi:hypothetical protein
MQFTESELRDTLTTAIQEAIATAKLSNSVAESALGAITKIIQYLDDNKLSYEVNPWGSFDWIEIKINEHIECVDVSVDDTAIQFWIMNRDCRYDLDESMIPDSFGGVKIWNNCMILRFSPC